MATHMKRRHSVDTAAAAPAPLTSRLGHSTEANNGGSKSGEKSISRYFGSDASLAANSTRSQAITNGITYFICKDIQPYSVVENEGFKQLLRVRLKGEEPVPSFVYSSCNSQ